MRFGTREGSRATSGSFPFYRSAKNYCLTGSRGNTLLFIYGLGGNGKSVLP